MNEAFLHYIWKFKLYETPLLLSTGEPVEVLQAGMHNPHSGPDFTDARLKIGQTLWAGSVEIHLRASDWQRHGHQHNAAYNNVVLHVVATDDGTAYRQNGEAVACAVLRVPQRLAERHAQLLTNASWVACEDFLPTVDPLARRFWFDKLAVERSAQKAASLETMLTALSGDWAEAFYRFFARAMGFGTNADAFEMLATALPQRIVAKHKGNLHEIEALVFGQAGMLDAEVDDPYHAALRSEYAFLRHKYDLAPMDAKLWHFARMRPVNFPTVRLAQWSALVNGAVHLFSKILETSDFTELEHLFACQPSEYWRTHYQFGKPSAARAKSLGGASVQLLVVNAVVPMLYLYGKLHADDRLLERALAWLEKLPPEDNSIVAHWQRVGIGARSAFESQALIGLKKTYCDAGRCLECAIGHKFIRS